MAAAFKNVPAPRITSQKVAAEGRNEDGDQVRYELVETEHVTYVQRYVNGVGVSTAQYSGTRRPLAEPELLALIAQEQLEDWQPEPAPVGQEPEPAADPASETPVLRGRGPNRPDDEEVVWSQGDLAIVMVTGREYRYDLRQAGSTIDSVHATRSWRTERQGLIDKATGLLSAAA
jgi:hypothetical protein